MTSVSLLVEDSGTETLFSDDSPCDDDLSSPTTLTTTAAAERSGEPTMSNAPPSSSSASLLAPLSNLSNNRFSAANNEVNNRLAPPNIQPYSGVLEKGKAHVIRPIAFKPTLNQSGRFGMAGERYGSTPILTRPGSRLTLYGSSNDLRQSNSTLNGHHNNYSLDRKLRSSCQSVASSPPLAMTSLTSLPHKHYDSLESVVQKSPLINKSYRLASASGGSLLDLTPSPSDSGVSELEAALRDRDSELAYLRQTMEHNEQVIFRVYQEKERTWEREIRRLKNLHENNVRASSQKVFKMEQMLMMQNYQFQQEKKRLIAEAQRATCQNERLMQEVKVLKERLEETEWNLCQKTGEVSLMKTQLKDVQTEQTLKSQEFLQLRNDYKDVREILDGRETELKSLKESLDRRDEEVADLRNEITKLQLSKEEEPERLKREIEELREELSEVSINEYEGLEPGRTLRKSSKEDEKLNDLKVELEKRKQDFERERLIWAQEKEKVLRYQKQLQMNYIQMYRRTRALESEVESLSIELELDKTGMKKLNHLSQTIEL